MFSIITLLHIIANFFLRIIVNYYYLLLYHNRIIYYKWEKHMHTFSLLRHYYLLRLQVYNEDNCCTLLDPKCADVTPKFELRLRLSKN